MTINGQGSNEPSPPYSLKINAAGPQKYRDDQIRLAPVDASGMMGSTFISAFAETRLAMDVVTGRKALAVMKRTTKDASPRSRMQLGFDIYDPSSDEPPKK